MADLLTTIFSKGTFEDIKKLTEWLHIPKQELLDTIGTVLTSVPNVNGSLLVRVLEMLYEQEGEGFITWFFRDETRPHTCAYLIQGAGTSDHYGFLESLLECEAFERFRSQMVAWIFETILFTNKLRMLKWLMNKLKLGERLNHGAYFLVRSCQHRNEEFIRFLIDGVGVDPKIHLTSNIRMLLAWGDVKLLQFLLSRVHTIGQEVIDSLADKGSAEMAKALFESGKFNPTDINFEYVLEKAIVNGKVELFDYILNNEKVTVKVPKFIVKTIVAYWNDYSEFNTYLFHPKLALSPEEAEEILHERIGIIPERAPKYNLIKKLLSIPLFSEIANDPERLVPILTRFGGFRAGLNVKEFILPKMDEHIPYYGGTQ